MFFNSLFRQRYFFPVLRILCITVVLLFIESCNKDEIILNNNLTETNTQERLQGFINFEALLDNIGESTAFKANIKYLDINRSAPLSGKGVDFVDAYIDTNTIHLIESDSLNFYTLKIINNNPAEKANTFYNLVFEQNVVTGQVTSVILQ